MLCVDIYAMRPDGWIRNSTTVRGRAFYDVKGIYRAGKKGLCPQHLGKPSAVDMTNGFNEHIALTAKT